MRLPGNLYCTPHIFGSVWLSHWKQPTLVLYPHGKTEAGKRPIVAANCEVSQCTSFGNEGPTYLLVPEVELQSASRTEPVGRLRTCSCLPIQLPIRFSFGGL